MARVDDSSICALEELYPLVVRCRILNMLIKSNLVAGDDVERQTMLEGDPCCGEGEAIKDS